MGYAIIRNADISRDDVSVLALVDRRKIKRAWWTAIDSSVIVKFNSRSEAERRARTLQFGNARVVSLDNAVAMIRDQREEIVISRDMDEVEAGWDGHKIWG